MFTERKFDYNSIKKVEQKKETGRKQRTHIFSFERNFVRFQWEKTVNLKQSSELY